MRSEYAYKFTHAMNSLGISNFSSAYHRGWLKICRHWGVHRYLSPLLSPRKPEKWVFLLGAYNSGTTLLNALLGMHPQISSLPYEGVTLASRLDRPEDYGWPRMWHKCIADLQLSDTVEESIAVSTQREWGLCFDGRKPVFVEKSIVNAVHIDWLKTFFKPAYFIHIVRNGYAVAEGIRRRTMGAAPGGEYSIADCAFQWAYTNQVVREGLVDYPHVLTMSYEDLTRNPLKELGRIADFLDLERNWPPLSDRIRVHGKFDYISNQNYKSLQRLSGGDIDSINSVAGDELGFYGYESIVRCEINE